MKNSPVPTPTPVGLVAPIFLNGTTPRLQTVHTKGVASKQKGIALAPDKLNKILSWLRTSGPLVHLTKTLSLSRFQLINAAILAPA